MSTVPKRSAPASLVLAGALIVGIGSSTGQPPDSPVPGGRLALTRAATPVPKERASAGGRAELARQQREAVAAIEQLGGEVYYDYQRHDPRRPDVFDSTAQLDVPQALRDKYGDDHFRVVVCINTFAKPGVADDDLKHLAKLPFLESLNLNQTQVTDAGLAHLKGLRNLRVLSLRKTGVGDAGLAHLEGLAGLWTLSLDETKVTDAGLVHLTGLTNLQTLMLEGTKVTDEGLGHLAGLTKLRWLSFELTGVTENGVKKLQKSLKGAGISFGVDPHR